MSAFPLPPSMSAVTFMAPPASTTAKRKVPSMFLGTTNAIKNPTQSAPTRQGLRMFVQVQAPESSEHENDPITLIPRFSSSVCAFATEVTPYLFLGNADDAMNQTALRRHGISSILNVAKELDDVCTQTPGLNVCMIPLTDTTDQALLPHLEKAIAFIERCRATGGRVLVHCRRGVSRSAAVVIAYMMAHYDLSFSDAFERVKIRRAHVSPNLGFCLALEKYEKKLRATAECNTGASDDGDDTTPRPLPLDPDTDEVDSYEQDTI